jgi:Protein of unknown function (DUF3300)
MYRFIVAQIVSVSLLLASCSFGTAELFAQSNASTNQQAMDKLLAPIALYPDALLAQVLACASSPQQVTEVNKWLQQNSQLQGTDLQAEIEKAGFDASFIALVLFPDVLKLMEQNLVWTTELGNAFTSDQKAVLDSVQRLRAKARAVGTLKTTPQQEVKSETQNGQTIIVVQPANPQVVYVPQYNPQVVYAPPPAPSSGEVAAAALIGFGLGIALAASMNNNYYEYHGWGAWGMRWNTRVVVVSGGAWRAPAYGRYPYARPMPAYRPNVNINAPRYSSVNVNRNTVNINNPNGKVNNTNVNRNNLNVNNANAYGRTPRPTSTLAATSPAQNKSSWTQPAKATDSNAASRGRAPSYSSASTSTTRPAASPVGQMESGKSTSAFSGYQSGSSERAASTRGKSSSGSSAASNGARRRN